ncbi:MAG: hypothetical protein IJ131_08475 [Eggerthellaceae bacterium]|nr:hypothetical protein [Eggerthellaceae bacterium]
MTDMIKASPEAESGLGIDENINISTIDEWLGRPDCVYREMRMVEDSAPFETMGGSRYLNTVLEGFKVCPYPYIGTVAPMPLEGAYNGPCLYQIEWSQEGQLLSARPNYRESQQIIEELFPKDKNILMTCGLGGYVNNMRQLLIFLGWDADRIYNVGGMWGYAGSHGIQLVDSSGASPVYYLWRGDIAVLDLSSFTPL